MVIKISLSFIKTAGLSLLGMLIMATNGVAVEKIYCLTYVFKIVNGACVDERFHMVPADDAYRMQSFRSFNVKGTARSHSVLSDMNSHTDPQTGARHDALCRLLVRQGRISLESDRCFEDTRALDEIVFCYQGFVRYPFTIINQGYRREDGVFEVEMRIRFASVASPERWSSLCRQKKLRETLKAIGSWF
jgi:hypothetical protein